MERLAEQLESAIKVRSCRSERDGASQCAVPHLENVVNRTRSLPRITPPFPVKSWCAFFWPRPQSQNSAVRYGKPFSPSYVCVFACRRVFFSPCGFQGLNFSGADLSRLDLRYINFKMANLSRCNLTHANLCCSNLERADLSGANLDVRDLNAGSSLKLSSLSTAAFILKGANLQGVKMLCTNAEGASLRGCNFEDPSGLKANLEGKPLAV